MSNDDYSTLNSKLDDALRTLDECTKLVIALDFDPTSNGRLIYNAASELFALRRNLYTLRPELTPKHMVPEND
jgi:hypothetical protein